MRGMKKVMGWRKEGEALSQVARQGFPGQVTSVRSWGGKKAFQAEETIREKDLYPAVWLNMNIRRECKAMKRVFFLWTVSPFYFRAKSFIACFPI